MRMKLPKCELFVILMFLTILASLRIQPFVVSFPSTSYSSNSTAPATEWNKTYGGLGSQGAVSVAQLTEGYILFGKNGMNAWLVRTDIFGNIIWNRTYARLPNTEVEVKSGTMTNDGGCIIAGGLRSIQTGICDAWLIKIDEFGNSEWNMTYGYDGHEIAFSAQQTIDGGYILAGVQAPLGVNDNDFYLIKTNAEGNIEWEKTYGTPSSGECAWSAQQTNDMGYILVGARANIGDGSWTDGWVVKTDNSGNMIWNLTYGRPEGGEWIYCVQQTDDNGYIMAGCHDRRPTAPPGISGDFWLLKTDSDGSIQWSKQYGDTDPFSGRYESAQSVQQTSDNGFIAVGEVSTGSQESEIWLIRTDFYGNMIWNTTYEGGASTVIQTNDGGYAIAGNSPWVSMEEGVDMLLIKMMRANPPVAHFSYKPAFPSVSEKIIFNASSTYDLDEDIVSYFWDFSDSNMTTTTPTITHLYTVPGLYNVTLLVTDSENLSSSYIQTVWVRMNTSITISTSSWSSVDGFSINITGTLSDRLGNPFRDETVVLYGNGGQIASEHTDEFGNYTKTWMPPTIKGFQITAVWTGNLTHFQAQNATSVIMDASNIISLSSSTSLIGYKVEINGSFTVNDMAYSDAPILIVYSVTQGQTWNDITLVTTDFDGRYSAVWMPTATGSFVVKASWTGNPNYPGASATVNLMVTQVDQQNVFSVTSNSTISALMFNSSSRELSFTVSGPSGTTGYVTAYIAKSLIGNIADVEVYLDGTQSDYTATSQDDTWQIHLVVCSHSAHEVVVSLGHLAGFVLPQMQDLMLILLGIAAILAVGFFMVKRKRDRTQQ